MRRRIRFIVLIVGAVTAAGSIASCGRKSAGDLEMGYSMSNKTIEQVLKGRTDEWMAIPGVEGTAIGLFEDKPCITIFSSVKAEELRAKIPTTIEGYPVIVEETGIFRALEQ